jgi:hypothetical protein
MHFKYIIILLLLIPITQAVQISEIMYDPIEDENYNEWIEIYNDGESNINLSEWTLCGSKIAPGYIDYTSKEVFENKGTMLLSGEFAIITDGGSDSGTNVYSFFENKGLAVHVATASLCGRLSNSGKTITLEGTESIEIIYSDDAEPGQSLQFENNNWCASEPTFGYENNCGLQESETEQPEQQEEQQDIEQPEENKQDTTKPSSDIILEESEEEKPQKEIEVVKISAEVSKQLEEINTKEEVQTIKSSPEVIKTTSNIVYESQVQEVKNLPLLLLLTVSIILNVVLIASAIRK